jgi:hypothetical protein
VEVSYGEGVASHSGPESCVCDRKVVGEALTGGAASRDIEPRKSHKEQDASLVQLGEGQHRSNRSGKVDRVLRGRRPRARLPAAWSRMVCAVLTATTSPLWLRIRSRSMPGYRYLKPGDRRRESETGR